jgi:small subunit ribosomal protein S3
MPWVSEWFGKTRAQAAQFFVEDIKLREFVEVFYARVGISKTLIRKTEKECEIIIFTAKPAAILGKEGQKLKEFEAALLKKFKKQVKVQVKEIKVPELSAKIMSEFAAMQIEGRTPYRKVAKSILQKVMEKGAQGVKFQIGGRLAGADISRAEKFIDGRLPLQTLKADIDYHYTTALTKYGILGIKVWICKGELEKRSAKKVQLEKIVD